MNIGLKKPQRSRVFNLQLRDEGTGNFCFGVCHLFCEYFWRLRTGRCKGSVWRPGNGKGECIGVYIDQTVLLFGWK